MIDLLSKMLEFNPNKRWSAEKCLNHKIFDKFKNEIISIAPYKIQIFEAEKNEYTTENLIMILQNQIDQIKSSFK